MVWVGILNENIIGPYFFDANVDANEYLHMLRTFVLPELERFGYDPANVWFMHDGAPAHYTLEVRAFLSNNFQGWIGRRHSRRVPNERDNNINDTIIDWPARSPDFFVWGFVKNLVFQNRAQTIAELRLKITEALDNITAQMLNNTTHIAIFTKD